MPQVNDFDFALAFVDLVINQNRAVEQFSDMRSLTGHAAYARKASQQLDMIQQGTAESRSGGGIVHGNVADQCFKVG